MTDGGSSRPTGAVLMLRALGLGDFLTGVPAFRAVRRAFPDVRLVLAAPPALAGLAPLTGAVDELLPTGELEPIGWPGPPPALAIDLHGRGPASHDLVAALRPRRLIVFGGAHGGGYQGPDWRADEHEVTRWCRLCAESGIAADPSDLRLAPAPAVTGQSWPPWQPAPTIVHPGAGSASRRWPVGRFAAVARRLARAGHSVLVTGSAAERDLAMRLTQLAELPDRCVLAGRTQLLELAAITARARLVICGDTGMCHLAAAFGRPLVALYGPTPPALWGPPAAPGTEVLWPASPGYRGDPHGATADPVLASISVPAVLAAVERAEAAAGQAGTAADPAPAEASSSPAAIAAAVGATSPNAAAADRSPANRAAADRAPAAPADRAPAAPADRAPADRAAADRAAARQVAGGPAPGAGPPGRSAIPAGRD